MEPRRQNENTSPARDAQQSTRVPVMEEHLNVGIARQETGSVRAIKKVHEEEVIVSGPVMQDELQIERIPLHEYVDTPPGVRYEGETMIIPVVKEEVVIQTRLVLVEEVRVSKRQVEKNIETPVTLRSEEIVVERRSTPPSKSSDK